MAMSTHSPRWPPRSPHEALLSSPSGRNKLRQYNGRTSPSPSPLKKSATTPNLGRTRRPALQEAVDEDEEDEETLQLRLDAIEARLKLKKLQQKKAKIVSTTSDVENERPIDKRRTASVSKPRQHYELDHPRPKSSAGIQIPVSPARKQKPIEEAKSPGRVLLGIDKGLKGRNVSLKRPPAKSQLTEGDDPFVSRRSTQEQSRSNIFSSNAGDSCRKSPVKSKTFSERIAETRQLDKEQKERASRIRKQRSTGFGVQDHEIERFKSAADKEDIKPRPDVSAKRDGFSRDEVLKAVNKYRGVTKNDTNSMASTQRRKSNEKTESTASRKHSRDLTTSEPAPSEISTPEEQVSPQDCNLYDPFSTFHLSKRILPHTFLTRTFDSKPIATIPDLLGSVKSPNYTLPSEYDTDFVVLAIIASKSSPLSHKDAHKSTTSESTSIAEAAESEQNARGKYMVLTLTDLKWSLELYLFTTAYTRFWKLSPGTLIAILNPSVMPPPPGKADTGRFSLVLNSSDDTVLEIGTSRDLGWCKSIRRDGKQCGSWIDRRHTEVCEFHVDRVIERTRAGRMEVNGISASFGPKGRGGGRTGFWGGKGRRGEENGNDNGLLKEGAQHDRRLGSSYFISPRLPSTFDRGSAASLLDAEGGLERGGSREERARKRLAEQEKEREIARRLGESGNGMAAEYLRMKHDGPIQKAGGASQETNVKDAKELGLVGNRACNVQLSPVKKRKAGEAWGTGEEKGMKKTRFLTSKGIKMAGRESGGGDIWLEAGKEGSEDELEVV